MTRALAVVGCWRLLQVPLRMAGPDLVKVLNNRGRVYVKLAMMGYAEADASEVRSGKGTLLWLIIKTLYGLR